MQLLAACLVDHEIIDPYGPRDPWLVSSCTSEEVESWWKLIQMERRNDCHVNTVGIFFFPFYNIDLPLLRISYVFKPLSANRKYFVNICL